MVKRFALYSLPPETDGDEFWHYHTREHAPQVIDACGPQLVRYAINRVIHQTKGQRQCFGVVETCWQDPLAMAAGFKALENTLLNNGKKIAQDYFERVSDDNVAFEVDEFTVKPKPVVSKEAGVKYMGFYSLPAGTDPDQFWAYHTRRHAVHSVDSFGSHLQGYAINRVTRTIKGPSICFGVVELWFAEADHLKQGFVAHKSVMLPEGVNVSDDFDRRVVDAFGFEVQEYIVKG